MASRSLRAVAEGEKPPPAKRAPRKVAPRTVQRAAAANDRRAELVAMRARIAKAIDDPGTHARDLAQLTRRQMEIATAIEAIDIASGKGPKRRSRTAVAETGNEAWNSEAI